MIIEFLKSYRDLFEVTGEQSGKCEVDPIFLLYSFLSILEKKKLIIIRGTLSPIHFSPPTAQETDQLMSLGPSPHRRWALHH